MERLKLVAVLAPRLFTCLAAGALLCWAAAQAGCNTVEGAGEDIQSAGEGISDVSRDVRD